MKYETKKTIGHSTMSDVFVWLKTDRVYSDATIVDYSSQVMRTKSLANENDLKNIPADLQAFENRFPRNKRFPNEFRSVDAYWAWRKKMISILRGFHGIHAAKKERKGRIDAWAEFIEYAAANVGVGTGLLPQTLIPIHVLIDVAREENISPKEVTNEWLSQKYQEVSNIARRSALSRAVDNINVLRSRSPKIDNIFLTESLRNPKKTLRAKNIGLSGLIKQEIDALIELHCRGILDPILEEEIGEKSASTKAVYYAALVKYIDSAIRCGALTRDTAHLRHAFEKTVFIPTMRSWMTEADSSRKISDRSIFHYTQCLLGLATTLSVGDVSFIEAALTGNRIIQKGRKDSKVMPLKTRDFCERLLRNRDLELKFLSSHINFQRQANDLIETDRNFFGRETKIIQLGCLAAFSAIALWSVPLRISNMLNLRHLGPEPNLIQPARRKGEWHLLLKAEEVKNRRDIKAPISDGPTKALTVLKWYLAEIRPRIPLANESNYFFCGFRGPSLSAGSMRNWLLEHSSKLGIPMDPHNFRHGLASLYLRSHPGEYAQAATLLCNTEATVRRHYAWIDSEAEMRSVQEELIQIGGLKNAR
ncbi:hypothetical protein AB4874_10915 [Thioclava sp. 15-R06ZXC-3]|uniref:Tyr recombinase domain-containing protein n=1 Tax=Thioclava arctica TaxID=3238301 RepID=A0ABV3TMY5_9RHOB